MKVEDSFPEAVAEWRTTADLDERAKLAAEYAERYALDHHGLDDEFWARMKAAYTDNEIVELSHVPGLVAVLRPAQPGARAWTPRASCPSHYQEQGAVRELT